jgi:hypothetical protein
MFVPATKLGVAVPVPPLATGITLAAIAKLGVLVEFVTVGTNQVGQEPLGAAKLVTVPEPGTPENVS